MSSHICQRRKLQDLRTFKQYSGNTKTISWCFKCKLNTFQICVFCLDYYSKKLQANCDFCPIYKGNPVSSHFCYRCFFRRLLRVTLRCNRQKLRYVMYPNTVRYVITTVLFIMGTIKYRCIRGGRGYKSFSSGMYFLAHLV